LCGIEVFSVHSLKYIMFSYEISVYNLKNLLNII